LRDREGLLKKKKNYANSLTPKRKKLPLGESPSREIWRRGRKGTGPLGEKGERESPIFHQREKALGMGGGGHEVKQGRSYLLLGGMRLADQTTTV